MQRKPDNVISLKDAINRLIETYKLKPGLYEAQLINSWGKIAGKMIEKHTRSLRLKRNTLYIELDSPALKDELNYQKTDLINKINSDLGRDAVNKVVIT